jgi:hypothetical protein
LAGLGDSQGVFLVEASSKRIHHREPPKFVVKIKGIAAGDILLFFKDQQDENEKQISESTLSRYTRSAIFN